MFIDKVLQKLLPIKHSAGLHKILANLSWLFADKVLRMGCGLLISIWIARYLGVKQFGIFNYATAFVALFMPIATLGLDTIVVHQLSDRRLNKADILGTTLCLRLVSGLTSIVMAVGSIFFIRQGDTIAITLITVLSVVGVVQSFDTIDLWFQSQVRSKYTVIAKNIAFVSIVAFKVFLITTQASLVMFAWATLLESCISSIGLIVAYKINGFSIWAWQWDFTIAKSLLTKGLPLILSGLAITVYMRIDQIMLGEMVDDRAVGIYSVATRISEVWYFIPMAISNSVSPAIYKAKEISDSLYYQRIKQLHQILNLISIGIALPMTFLSEPIITKLYGSTYAEAGTILSIHIWASIFVSMGFATTAWFIAEGLTVVAMYKTLTGAVINIILNLFLIPAYAGVGAAIATVVSYAVAGLFFHAIHPKTRKMFWLQIGSLSVPKM